MYSFENIKDVWNALLERNEIAQKSNSIQIKELTIEVLTDKINDTDQHVILGETNKNGVMIVSKLMVKNEHYVLSNEIAMYHDCTSISNITLMNGHWTFENKNNKIDTIEIISIH
ncbi:hypothetical protein [Kordia sp.]|uniref:hypothetical protein n=1 Tax=Kordia sp. TaxID=1965332 RepID=UPI003D2843D2